MMVVVKGNEFLNPYRRGEPKHKTIIMKYMHKCVLSRKTNCVFEKL